MKNVVFIPYIKRENDVTKSSSIGHSNRHSGYEYGIKSWKSWCKKQIINSQVFLQMVIMNGLTELLMVILKCFLTKNIVYHLLNFL